MPFATGRQVGRLLLVLHVVGTVVGSKLKRKVDTGRFGSALKGGFCFDSCCYQMTDSTKASQLPPNAQTEQKQFCQKMFQEVRGDPCKFIDDSRGRYVAFLSREMQVTVAVAVMVMVMVMVMLMVMLMLMLPTALLLCGVPHQQVSYRHDLRST